ncbi:MAG: hypothetical protein JXM73_11130 [Anaerolineae bacterium]|nr:hypothetical protein [Anaerolineae bacterium]
MSEEQKPTGDVWDELKLFGQQLGTAVKSLWDSEESRNLRKEISEGLSEAVREMDKAVKDVRESDAAKEFGEQVRGTVDKARESDVVGQVQQGLVTGLRDLNAELSKLLSSWETQKPAEPAEPPAAGTEE